MVPGFDLIDRIGESTGSQLFRARRSSDARILLLRVPRDETLQDRAGFRREFEFLKQHRLPGLAIPLLFCDTTQPAIVLRDSPGRLLNLLLDESRLDLRASLNIACNLARTLSGLHNAGVIHRDLQPSNILVSPDDWSTCIIDCSVCSGAISGEMLEHESDYIAPELARQRTSDVGPEADLYSLGVLLYRLLTGRLPHGLSGTLHDIPFTLSSIVLKLLAESPQERYRSAQDLERDLAECIPQLEGAAAHDKVARAHESEETQPFSPGGQIDAMSVIRASHALSSQLEPEQLLRTLMSIVLQSAGAQRGCLFLVHGDNLDLAATGTSDQKTTNVLVDGEAGFPDQAAPLSVIDYVRRTRQRVLIEEGSASSFSSDRYLLNTRPKSLLCLPLLNQAELTGLLYLENHLSSNGFTPQHLAMLEAIASQAAISLQNARLYASLQRENAERRRKEEHLRWREAFLAEGERLSHTGSAFRNLVTGERHWSNELFNLLGYSAEKVSPSLERFIQRVHPEDRHMLDWSSESLERQTEDREFWYRLLLPDGHIKYIHHVNHPVLDDAGRPVMIYAVVMDETEQRRAEEELRRSEALLAQGEGLSHTGTIFWDLITDVHHWSDEFFRILGYEPGKAQPCLESFLERVHPDDRASLRVDATGLVRQRTDYERRYRLALPDGSVRYIHGILHPVFNDAGDLIAFYGVAVDQTDRKRAELLREGEARVLEMIARSAPLPDILSELVRVVESQVDGMLCTVLLLEQDGIHIRHGASPSLPVSYTRPINGEEIGPGRGSCGTAAYLKQTVVVTDIANDPQWEPWRALALQHGLRSCWSTPIFSSDGKVLGTFAMYYRQTRAPVSAELELIHQAAHLAGIGIERKRMEAALVESRNELQQVTNSISDSVWSADVSAEGEVTLRYSSPVVERLAGRPPEFFMESPDRWLSVVHPEDKDWVRHRLETSARTLTAAPEAEYRIVLPDGSIRWIRDSVRATPIENGGMRMHGVLSDITARKQAEEGFRQSRELLQNVLGSSEAVIYVKDLEGRYLLANRGVSQLSGLSPEAIIGRTDYDIFSREQAEEFRSTDQQAFTSGRPLEIEETMRTADRQQRTYISVKSVLRDKNGKPYAVCGVSTDITERKRLEEQLREAQKMEAIGKLAGGIAHDFNNLMTIVTGYSELLQSALADAPSLQEKATEIHKAGEQAASLTRQLLAFSRRQVLQKRLLNLNEVLSNMFSMMRRLLRDDIELRVEPGPALAPVRGDSGQIQQIIMNLILNARDAMPEGGRITIATANADCNGHSSPSGGGLQGSWVRVTVSDTGHGMPAEVREHIFEPFFTTKEPGRGTGLGLATVHGVVQQAGGRVAVESEPGRGTTFNIYLPTAQGEVGPKPLVMPVPERGSETILVVEDQEGLRLLITEILQKHGYKVLAASNGREALHVLEKTTGRIDMMITDLVMPQMGGRALAAALPDFHPETGVVYMSGYVENVEELLAPGHEFIEKPFTPDLLLRRVRELLDRRPNLARPA